MANPIFGLDQHDTPYDKRTADIFISIAAYRDPQLFPTLRSAIANAAIPSRLRFGIVWQGESLIDWQRGFLEGIEAQWLEYKSSQGACWARAIAQTLWKSEPYFLQIDSHMRFAPNWDTRLIEWLEYCRNLSEFDRPILSAYVPCWDYDTKGHEMFWGEPQALDIDWSEINTYQVPLLKATHSLSHRTDPYPNRYIAAGFIFTDSHFVENVPYDPLIYFQGEEISLSVRAWTHGYNVFNPHWTAMWHRYGNAGRSVHWEDDGTWANRDAISKLRVRSLLGLMNPPLYPPIKFGRFGLGTKRSFSSFTPFQQTKIA